jgi:hypothetical protein
MAEQYKNLDTTTLNGAINNSTTSVVVADGSVFPSTGTFRINIENEIMKVTGRSTNTLTVVRGQEGTTAASHADGVKVSGVLTKDALLNLNSQLLLYDNWSDIPAAGYEGRLAYIKDDGLIQRDDGTNWKSVGWFPNLFDTALIPGGSPTWLNQDGATWTVLGKTAVLSKDGVGGSTERVSGVRVSNSISASSWNYSCAFLPTYQANDSTANMGIYIRDSSTGKLMTIGPRMVNPPLMLVSQYTSTTSWNSNVANWYYYEYQPCIVRIEKVNSTTYNAYVSADGIVWNQIKSGLSIGGGNFVNAPDEIGVYINTVNTSGYHFKMHILGIEFTG